jgi:hypothetical protein
MASVTVYLDADDIDPGYIDKDSITPEAVKELLRRVSLDMEDNYLPRAIENNIEVMLNDGKLRMVEEL